MKTGSVQIGIKKIKALIYKTLKLYSCNAGQKYIFHARFISLHLPEYKQKPQLTDLIILIPVNSKTSAAVSLKE